MSLFSDWKYGRETWSKVRFFPNKDLCPFEGAPVPEPADVSLLYLGDVKISEEATLVELKSKVRPLPEAFFGVDMAYSQKILINIFFYFLFPQLQSVLIWHVLYAMVRGKYQQAAHIRHFWYLLVPLPWWFPLTQFSQACCACVCICPQGQVAYVHFDFLGNMASWIIYKAFPLVLHLYCLYIVIHLSLVPSCVVWVSLGQLSADCIRMLTWTFVVLYVTFSPCSWEGWMILQHTVMGQHLVLLDCFCY